MLADAPLSFAQEEIWLRQQIDPDEPIHSQSVAYRIKGRLDSSALERAVRLLVAGQPALRTAVVHDDDAPVQRVLDAAPFELPVHDLTEVPAGEQRELAAQAVLASEARRPFDLTAGLMLRGLLLRLDGSDWILLLTSHRILVDGPSLAVLEQELAAGYGSALGGSAAVARTVPPAHLDHARRQREAADSGQSADRLAARAAALADAPSSSTFRADLARPVLPKNPAARARTVFGAGLADRLAGTAERLGVPSPVFALAVFTLLVHRQTGQAEVVVGLPTDLRGPESRDSVGQFGNLLPVRSGYDGRRSFTDHLRTTVEAHRFATEQREVPFELLLRRLNLRGEAGQRQLVQLEFDFREDDGRSALVLPGLTVTPLETAPSHTSAELALAVEASEDGDLRCTADYSAELFTPDAVGRLLGHFGRLLEQVLDDPGRRLDSLTLLTEEESAQLAAWNATDAAFPADTLLHELFEEQAARTPDADAVVHGERSLSYAELESRANQLARLLIEQGVAVDDAVAVCMDRSPELVIALLAVLKAGAGYLPLDPESPRARLDRIAADARVTVCLTLGHQRDRCPSVASVISLDDPWPAAEQSSERPVVPVAPENLVSVYYTSGSTGNPKGVASTHRGWVNRMVWMQLQHGLAAGETVLHKTTLTFDDSALELFWPLSVGGRCALIDPELHRDPEAILTAAVTYRTVHLQTVPSMLAMLIDTVGPEHRAGLAALRSTVSSGEALPPDLVRRFQESMPGRLHNTWGATEVSIDSTDRLCTAADAAGSGAVSVGSPFDNNQVHVLDHRLAELPVDVVGDLYIGGVGLARGYLGDPAKTAQAFVASPFRAGERLYRTGDQGYRRADGSIIFVGRQDHQVKIRGMRVELGEIESVLRSHPDVGQAVVTVHRTDSGHQRLAAYVAAKDRAHPAEESVRAHVARLLPSYMRPAALHVLEQLPLNANGKIDRHQLPAPSFDEDRSAAGGAPLDGDFEPVLAAIWQDVLQSGAVWADSNFFDMGGQSLSAAQAVARIRQRFTIELPLRELFTTPVLRGFSAVVERRVLERVSSMSEEELLRLLQQAGE